MKVVSNWEDSKREWLNDEQIKRCLGQNKGLLNIYKKGKIDTLINICYDTGTDTYPGAKLDMRIPPLEKFITYIVENFELDEDGKYWFGIVDNPGDDEIYMECSSGEFYIYKNNKGTPIQSDLYPFKGDVLKLNRLFEEFISWTSEARIPLSQIVIHPKNSEYFSKSHFKEVNHCYVGYREAVFDEEMPDIDCFEITCGYEETPGEYVMAILV